MTSTGYEFLARRLVDELNFERVEASATLVEYLGDDEPSPMSPAPALRPPLEVRCRYRRPRQVLEVAIVEVGQPRDAEPLARVAVTRTVLQRVNGHVLRLDVEAGLRSQLARRGR